MKSYYIINYKLPTIDIGIISLCNVYSGTSIVTLSSKSEEALFLLKYSELIYESKTLTMSGSFFTNKTKTPNEYMKKYWNADQVIDQNPFSWKYKFNDNKKYIQFILKYNYYINRLY